MLKHPEIDPIAISLGPVDVHWYGIMYLVAFGLAYWLGNLRANRPNSGWNTEQVGDLIFYGAMGVVLGGRVGYILFYNFGAFLDNPLLLFQVWKGGMSFHGGLLGVLVALWLFGRKRGKTFFQVGDFVAPLVPLGYFAGRMGNFINGELWGRVTDVPWGMLFRDGGPDSRHPSMLYQGFLEGLVLFLILWFFSNKPRPLMATSALFLIGMGTFRIINEFFRQPDAHIGFIAFEWLTMGQILSVPMVIGGAALMWYAYQQKSVLEPVKKSKKSKRK